MDSTLKIACVFQVTNIIEMSLVKIKYFTNSEPDKFPKFGTLSSSLPCRVLIANPSAVHLFNFSATELVIPSTYPILSVPFQITNSSPLNSSPILSTSSTINALDRNRISSSHVNICCNHDINKIISLIGPHYDIKSSSTIQNAYSRVPLSHADKIGCSYENIHHLLNLSFSKNPLGDKFSPKTINFNLLHLLQTANGPPVSLPSGGLGISSIAVLLRSLQSILELIFDDKESFFDSFFHPLIHFLGMDGYSSPQAVHPLLMLQLVSDALEKMSSILRNSLNSTASQQDLRPLLINAMTIDLDKAIQNNSYFISHHLGRFNTSSSSTSKKRPIEIISAVKPTVQSSKIAKPSGKYCTLSLSNIFLPSREPCQKPNCHYVHLTKLPNPLSTQDRSVFLQATSYMKESSLKSALITAINNAL